jgi:hypothetical protein
VAKVCSYEVIRNLWMMDWKKFDNLETFDSFISGMTAEYYYILTGVRYVIPHWRLFKESNIILKYVIHNCKKLNRKFISGKNFLLNRFYQYVQISGSWFWSQTTRTGTLTIRLRTISLRTKCPLGDAFLRRCVSKTMQSVLNFFH